MRKHIFAPYIMENSVHEMRVSDLLRMTHLNIAFGHVKDSIVTVDHLNHLDRIAIYKSVNPELKVILSIGGWGADGFNQAAQTQEGRESFARTAMDIVLKWDFDGMDIDWEYPCSDQAGIAYGPEDKVNFTLLLEELRKVLDAEGVKNGKKYLLTAAVGGEAYFIEGTEMDKVAQILDYVNLMTYDLRGGFTNVTGHHASLGPQTGDENGPCSMRTVQLFHDAGVPYEKMVLGAAFYGRMWAGVSSTENNGLGQVAKTTGSGYVRFDIQDEEQVKLHGYTKYFDEKAQAPYLFNGENFVSFEDAASIKAKCDFVKEKGLAGMMYWAYGNHRLFEVMDANLD
jgi:chitinase